MKPPEMAEIDQHGTDYTDKKKKKIQFLSDQQTKNTDEHKGEPRKIKGNLTSLK